MPWLCCNLHTNAVHAGFELHEVDKSIKVVSGPRALVDILRSIAHELVHAKQDQEMRLMPGSGEDGSPIENEAHALAGLIMRKFEKDNKHIYEQ